jgi:uncharacterized protein
MIGASAVRREELLGVLKGSSAPITGSALAAKLGVSRQAIVNDVAILRAGGHGIIGSTQGYRMDGASGSVTAVIHCLHEPDRGREEFEVLLDRGVSVLDVGVQHSVFGEVRANVLIESRADIERHAEAIRRSGEAPLSIITRGIHSHRVRAPSEEALEAARRELAERGILLDD